jgi:hypothetical protein
MTEHHHHADASGGGPPPMAAGPPAGFGGPHHHHGHDHGRRAEVPGPEARGLIEGRPDGLPFEDARLAGRRSGSAGRYRIARRGGFSVVRSLVSLVLFAGMLSVGAWIVWQFLHQTPPTP